MDRPWTNLKVFAAAPAFPPTIEAMLDPVAGHALTPNHHPTPDATILANQELIRPVGFRRPEAGLAPYSAAWYDELEQKRYQRHGAWLPAALEFGRHPGESLLLLGPGVGSDAVRYVRTGTPVTVGLTSHDHAEQVRENITRNSIPAKIVNLEGPVMPFPDGAFDVVVWNALYEPAFPDGARIDEVFRILKAGGKIIALFPAWYDAGFWQDVLLPLQWVYWRRPVDPTSAPKTTARQLRKAFAPFTHHRIAKRHLRRSELPHLWRVLPLVLLERLIGRVLVFKALKPLTARTGLLTPLAA
jgi:SAM-dependent methyltransferase